MKKLFGLLAFALIFPLQACAQQQPWQEGTHYEVIADEATAKPEIIEFFSFWCPACNAFEPLVAQMKSKIDDNVKFEKVHVNFMRFAEEETQNSATRAMVIGRLLKQEEKFNKAIFDYIHNQNASITEMRDLKNIFQLHGVEADEFDKLSSNFSVNSMVSRNNKKIEEYRRHVSGVPGFIINGKYKAKFTREMSPDQIVELVVWLSKQK